MTEAEIKNQNKKADQSKNSERKKQFFLTKIIIFISLILFAYFGIKYWQVEKGKKEQARASVQKFDDSDIFDLSEDYKKNHAEEQFDMAVEDLRERGAEFIYRLLLKNQVKIEELKTEIQSLKSEFLKYKSQEKIAKMIMAYFDLRKKIFTDSPYSEELKSFEVMVAFDKNLQSKTEKIKSLLPDFIGQKKLVKSFQALIPDLISNKMNESGAQDGDGIIAKIRHNIKKLVIIRRIDGKNPNDLSGIIAKIERSLLEENYQEALSASLLMDQYHHETIKKFLDNLGNAVEIKKTDQEILDYLRSII